MSTFFKTASICALLTLSASASAYTIDSSAIDVGGVDYLDPTYQTILANSGNSATDTANELGWIQSLLGTDYSLGDKFEDGSLAPIEVDQGGGVYAHELANSPEYFLIKIGGGHWGGNTHFLYENLDNTAYGVFDFGDFQETCTAIDSTPGNPGTTCTIDIDRVSHITPTTTSVPEPNSIALMGIGLLGMGAAVRRRRKS